jgi:hypothetical protein
MTLALVILAVCLVLAIVAFALIHGARIIADVMDEEIDLATGQNIDAPPPEGF